VKATQRNNRKMKRTWNATIQIQVIIIQLCTKTHDFINPPPHRLKFLATSTSGTIWIAQTRPSLGFLFIHHPSLLQTKQSLLAFSTLHFWIGLYFHLISEPLQQCRVKESKIVFPSFFFNLKPNLQIPIN
jgi:hypothetical protein